MPASTRYLIAKPLLGLLGMLACASLVLADDIYVAGVRSTDGIGKYYMGREISQVMGHRGARWLERSAREREERTDKLLELLPLEPDNVVADIGAGSGYFALPIAERVPHGKVIAIQI